MKKIVTIALVVLGTGAMIFVLAKNKQTLEAARVVNDRSNIPVNVLTEKVQLKELDEAFSLPATMVAEEDVYVASSIGGRLVSMQVKLGSRVEKGQVIAQVDSRDNEIRLQTLELTIEKLKRDYERNKTLALGDAINQKALQDSKFELDAKELEAKQLKKQISDAVLRAPVSGIISEKNKEAGEFVSVGEKIARIVNVQSLKARVYVPENRVVRLASGHKARVSADVLPGEVFDGTVSYISPQGDDNHNYMVEISLPLSRQASLKGGMYVQVRLNEGQAEKALLIPKAALANGVKNPVVYTVEGDKAVERPVTIGRQSQEMVEILSGLKEGEQVIISGQINLVNGSRIQVLK